MKPCTNTDSTLLSATAEASDDAQDSNAASDARRNRSLRHANEGGQSINDGWRFKLSPALFAFVFGILSMLLLPSTGRSQTVEELQQQILQMQQQISQLQGDKATYQQEIAGLEERKAAFEAQMPAIDALIQNAEGVYGMALAQALALINAQQAEREELELAQLGAMNYTDWLQEALDYLDQGSPTYTDDLNFITGELLGTQAVLSNVANRLNELDTAVGNAEALAGQAGQAYYGAQDLKDGVQQQIDALQAIIDSDNQSIQDIDSQIESLQNQINELNNM